MEHSPISLDLGSDTASYDPFNKGIKKDIAFNVAS